MFDDESACVLRSRRGDSPPALLGVDMRGELDGALLSLMLRQTYRNDGPDPIEVVYSFPLPHGAVLLGMVAEVEGRRWVGQVLPKAEAESTYESAVSEGDAPILLERTSAGLHTANLGNLNPGERVTLEIEFAQWLGFDQGRVRVVLPATLAPRYGNPLRAGLQPQQVPLSSLEVDYPLAVSLTVRGSLSRGEVTCPTHAHRLERSGDDVRIDLAPGAAMDRDVVILVRPAEPMPDLLMIGTDEASPDAPTVALAAFAVPPRPSRGSIALRLLVDCSGSMQGDGIASARQALHEVVAGLSAEDNVSLTRFGSHVEHVVGADSCSEERRAKLRAAIEGTQASLGGTEMAGALTAVFTAWPRRGEIVDVLLMTDGEVWEAAELITAARRSGHRVFAIGVGSAPAEGVLRELAEASGGAVEFATPGESLRLATARMLERIRQMPMQEIQVDWGSAPTWQSPLPRGAFGGDTLFALAGFTDVSARRVASARLLELDEGERTTEMTRTVKTVPVGGQDLARIAAARRLPAMSADVALQMALDYRLVTDRTHGVLVRERADGQRSEVPARLQRVPQMLAAGWGGVGMAGGDSFGALSTPVASALPATWRVRSASPLPDGFADLFSRPPTKGAPPIVPAAEKPLDEALRTSMQRVIDFLASGGSMADLAVECQTWTLHPAIREAMAEVDALFLGSSLAWLLLALWVARRDAGQGAAAARLTVHASDATPDEQQDILRVFDLHFIPLLEAPRSPRASRLARAMSRFK